MIVFEAMRRPSLDGTALNVDADRDCKHWSVGLWIRNIEAEAVYIGANKPAPNAPTAPYLLGPCT